MARIHSIEIFYASSNSALGKIVLKFSDGEGGILTKSVKGRFLLGICRMNIDRLSSSFRPIHMMEFTSAATGCPYHICAQRASEMTLFLKMSMKDEQFLSNEQQK